MQPDAINPTPSQPEIRAESLKTVAPRRQKRRPSERQGRWEATTKPHPTPLSGELPTEMLCRQLGESSRQMAILRGGGRGRGKGGPAKILAVGRPITAHLTWRCCGRSSGFDHRRRAEKGKEGKTGSWLLASFAPSSFAS